MRIDDPVTEIRVPRRRSEPGRFTLALAVLAAVVTLQPACGPLPEDPAAAGRADRADGIGATRMSEGPSAEADSPDPSAALSRCVVLGASASAGFGLSNAAGGSIDFSRVLGSLIAGLSEPPLDKAAQLFFLDPEGHGSRLVEEALFAEPSLVVAVDFLFWYAYGTVFRERDRLARLEAGLELVDRFACPVVIGKIPDMSDAVGIMLSASQVPDPSTLATLNERIDAFAAQRRHVIVAPVVRFLDDLAADRPIEIAGTSWPPGSRDELLQADHLHPTLTGLVVLGQLVLESVAQALGELDPAPRTDTDPTRVVEALFDGSAPAPPARAGK